MIEVSVIGLGAMGLPMARRIASALPVSAFDVDAARRGLGLDPQAVIDVLGRGAAASFMLSDRGPRMVEAYGDGAELRSRLDIFTKDMAIVTGVARDVRVPVPLAAAAAQLYLLGERAGLAGHDDSSIVTVLSPAENEPEKKGGTDE